MSSDYRYCPRCAAPLTSSEHGGFSRRVCTATACNFIFWDNPTPVVAAVVEHEGEIILARNALWTHRFFALITGFLERNEDPAEAVLREVEEEIGLQGVAANFIGHYRFDRMNQLIIAYHVEARGTVKLGDEISEIIRVAPQDARYWPAATGLALRDWLLSKGHPALPMDLPERNKP